MFPQHSHPALFDMSGFSIADAILMIIAQEPKLKARQIAYRLNTRFGFSDVARKDVNSLLYGGLRTQVKRVDDYRWVMHQRRAPRIVAKPPEPARQIPEPESMQSITMTPLPVYEKNPKMGFWARVKFIFNL